MPDDFHSLREQYVRHALEHFPVDSDSPFRGLARSLYRYQGTYENMLRWGGKAYSASWWQRLIEHGPWRGGLRPPANDTLDSIAQLFATTPEHVAEMIAADWYGVTMGVGVSERVRNLIPLIDGLSDEDTALLESLLRRLSQAEPEQ